MKEKYQNRIINLETKKENFCGLSIKEIKLLLNKLAKYDDIAKIYRYILEAECYSSKAKMCSQRYKDLNYMNKGRYIVKAFELCIKNNINCGYISVNKMQEGTDHIAYFDIPDCKQIAMHCNLDLKQNIKIPIYKNQFYNHGSNLSKLEEAISKRYEDEIKRKINYRDVSVPIINIKPKLINNYVESKTNNLSYLKIRTKNNPSGIVASTYKSICDIISNPEYSHMYVKTLQNPDGWFVLQGSNKRVDILIEDKHHLRLYRNVSSDKKNKDEIIIKVRHICLAYNNKKPVCYYR